MKGGNGSGGVAIVGVACRFPGAADHIAFWRNLREGVESITALSDQDLLAAGVPAALLGDPSYVKAAALLPDIDRFDAAFFEYSPEEARLMDPQQRLLLEVAWGLRGRRTIPRWRGAAGRRLHGFGRGGEQLPGRSAAGFRRTAGLHRQPHPSRQRQGFSEHPHFLQAQPDRAEHQHTDRLLDLAGGGAPRLPGDSRGRMRHGAGGSRCGAGAAGRRLCTSVKGGILSPDGHCRAFDADAQGTIFGSGVGAVLLKEMAAAVADGDHIYAVIKGSAINNDGADKVSYTASSAAGQARAMVEAMPMADVSPTHRLCRVPRNRHGRRRSRWRSTR